MRIYPIAALAALCSLVSLGGCGSLPDGAQKPDLTINECSIAKQNGMAGYMLHFSVSHRSKEALEANALSAEIFINGIKRAELVEELKDTLIVPNREQRYKRFIPATAAGPAETDTLLNSPMLQLGGVCKLNLIFDRDEALFNPIAIYQGTIKHE